MTSQPVVRVSEIRKTYGSLVAVADVSFEVQAADESGGRVDVDEPAMPRTDGRAGDG